MTGRVHKFGDDIDTDVIIAGTHLGSSDPAFLSKHAFDSVRPAFHTQVQPGDIIVAGRNFGCGSSREQAALAIKGLGISCIVVESAARIFHRSAINIALPILIAPEAAAAARDGDKMDIDIDAARVALNGTPYRAAPLAPKILEILNDGGLIRHMRRRIEYASTQ